ncbi:hypothetical protein M196_gp55 [Halorubrum tailed virus 4]|uniref:Uncharacterized protein n=1 Tax=Halorubrum tailed virus 4 TaxID=1273752 RepID=R4TKE9_9CAUD|nr:hypothetical protein M196_gp55 [Halorubrum tailed virus 4]AGM11147.1 hypothetical protein HRTV4_55 [Halorubrum tailed virus 4]
MSRWQLLAYQVVAAVMGLGVFFAFVLGATVAAGGTVRLDMTLFNEMWPEYWLMFVAVGLVPWAVWYLDDH